MRLSAPFPRRPLWRMLLPAAALALLAACGGETAPRAVHSAPELATFTVTPTAAVREQVWDGVVEALADSTIAAQTNARVLELPFDVGDRVAAGDVLVRFSDVEQRSGRQAAAASLAAAEAEFTDAQANWQRIQDVFARGLVAQAQLDAASARFNASRAAVNAARAALASAGQQADYTVVRAPFAGVVTRRFVDVGEAVQSGPPTPQPLISLASLEALRVDVVVPQSAIEAIRSHRAARVLAPDGTRIEAPALTIFPWADPASHTFRVRVDLPGEVAGLYPGMTTKVAFAVGESHRILVPANALVRRGELSGVFVVADGKVGLRQLRLGRLFDEQVEVLAGLAAGETVASDPEAAALYLGAVRTRHGS